MTTPETPWFETRSSTGEPRFLLVNPTLSPDAQREVGRRFQKYGNAKSTTIWFLGLFGLAGYGVIYLAYWAFHTFNQFIAWAVVGIAIIGVMVFYSWLDGISKRISAWPTATDIAPGVTVTHELPMEVYVRLAHAPATAAQKAQAQAHAWEWKQLDDLLGAAQASLTDAEESLGDEVTVTELRDRVAELTERTAWAYDHLMSQIDQSYLTVERIRERALIVTDEVEAALRAPRCPCGGCLDAPKEGATV